MNVVDIILTTYNRYELLRATWESLIANTDLARVAKIIISNDGSTDSTEKYLRKLKKQYPQIEILPKQRERMGLVPRFNAALERSTADIVVNIQDDLEFFPGWLELQLPCLNHADFVTGYDAPEHQAFGTCTAAGGYAVKHSAGFIQLTAYRKTWDRWFPMEPERDFPTPCMRDGRAIGSSIDTRIYGRVKNNPNCPTRYIVVPGMKHTANEHNSTWRPPGHVPGTVPPKAPPRMQIRAGGLPRERVPEYWSRRYQKQNTNAVGFAGRPEPEQRRILSEKQEFIRPHLVSDAMTIDYGCGIGAMAPMFEPGRYAGYDITPEFLTVARKNNSAHAFFQLHDPAGGTEFEFKPFGQFFTSNVLQHNEDSTVADLFAAVSRRQADGFFFVLYENTHPARDSGHMRFRRPQEYLALVGDSFKVKTFEFVSHRVHGEEHSLIKIEV